MATAAAAALLDWLSLAEAAAAAAAAAAALLFVVELGVRLLTETLDGDDVLLVCVDCELSRRLPTALAATTVEAEPFCFVPVDNDDAPLGVEGACGGGGVGILANLISNASSNFFAMNTTSDDSGLYL